MTPEQGLGNFEYLINLGVQKGIFPDANLVLAMTDAHKVLKVAITSVNAKVNDTIKIPADKSVTSTTADIYIEKSNNVKS